MPTALAQVDREKIYQWINELSSPETRENALLELSKKRESVPDLAPMLWHSFGTIAALLQVGWAICVFILWCSISTLQILCIHEVDLGRNWWDPLLPLLGSMIFVGSCGEWSRLRFECTSVALTQLCPGQHGGCHVT